MATLLPEFSLRWKQIDTRLGNVVIKRPQPLKPIDPDQQIKALTATIELLSGELKFHCERNRKLSEKLRVLMDEKSVEALPPLTEELKRKVWSAMTCSPDAPRAHYNTMDNALETAWEILQKRQSKND